jgi:uncharacterized protein (UPF0332 family)
MITNERKTIVKKNFDQYLRDGLIKKEINFAAKFTYLKNSDLSIKLANECMKSKLKPYLWVIVMSYYAMFYMANAVILDLGYKTKDKIVHKVTIDALIVLVMDKIKKELLEKYELVKGDALEIASLKSEEIINLYSLELDKRSKFQYNMSENVQKQKAETSMMRAKQFTFELKKLIR